jgi:hypothetical protein
MLKLTSRINVSNFEFAGVAGVKINSSWSELVDTCVISLPKKTSWEGRMLAMGGHPLLKRGDKVVVNLGYNDINVPEFAGFLTTIDAINTPLSINCQDGMFLLKRVSRTVSYKSVSLRKLIGDIVQEIAPFEVLMDVELGSYRFAKPVTPFEVLDNLRDKYCVKSFFRNGRLYVGLAIVPKLQKTHLFDFQRNVIQSDLGYNRKEDIRLKLKAVIFNNNKKENVEVGDEDGQTRTFHYRNISKADAKKLLEQELERLKYDGFKGSFLAFGAPSVQHGDIADLKNPFMPEQNGKYLIKGVEKTFDDKGYRQKIELEGRL